MMESPPLKPIHIVFGNLPRRMNGIIRKAKQKRRGSMLVYKLHSFTCKTVRNIFTTFVQRGLNLAIPIQRAKVIKFHSRFICRTIIIMGIRPKTIELVKSPTIRRLFGRVSHMPFSDKSRSVATIADHFTQSRLPFGNLCPRMQIVIETKALLINSRQDTCTRRSTYGTRHIPLAELYSPAGKCINIRCRYVYRPLITLHPPNPYHRQ